MQPVNYNCQPSEPDSMTLSLEAVCPECGATEFYKAASMELHLGTKRKWHCPDCDYGFVTINGIDTSVSA